MVNYRGNPNIAEHGKATRFGTGRNSPHAARAKASDPWSIRRAMRLLAGMTVGELEELATNADELTAAQAVAIAKICKALNGNVRAMQQVTDDIDGKSTDSTVSTKVTLADLVTGSLVYDEEFHNTLENLV